MEKYQRKVQPWLAKTDFPNVWPVPNAGKKETARLMEKGNEMDVSIITYGGVNHNSNYKKWAKVLLSKYDCVYNSLVKFALQRVK